MRLFIAVLAIAVSINTHAGEDSDVFQALLKRDWEFRMNEFPSLARDNGVEGYADRITHVAEKDQLRRYEFWKQVNLDLAVISCDRLEHEECINYRIFARQVHQFIANYETRGYLIPFTSDWGFYMSWNRWGEETEFSSVDDYRNYLARLKELPVVMDEYIGLMREGLRTGMTQPRVILDGREVPIRKQLVETLERSAFYQPFLSLDENIPDEVKPVLLADAKSTIMEGVIPAYQRLLDFFADEYVPGARTSLGASELPNGERFYKEQIYLYATVDMTADEIHQLGLSEVARIRAEMDAIIKGLEFEGSFAAFLEFLRTVAGGSVLFCQEDRWPPAPAIWQIATSALWRGAGTRQYRAFFHQWSLCGLSLISSPGWLLLGEHLRPGKPHAVYLARPDPARGSTGPSPAGRIGAGAG
jgi:uncharacterized protein (DUF885 family)